MATVICNYKTSNANRFYHGSASGFSGKGSILLGEALSAVEMMTALVASKMAAIRLSVQGVAAGGMSAWLAGQAVLPARGAAKQVRYLANMAFLAVVRAVASRLEIQPVVEFLLAVEAELAMAADQSVEPQSVGPGGLEKQATAAIPLRSHFLAAAKPHTCA
jgi:hypothetical protein